ncbi:MAG: GIY-YIG nuclease family protein [Clostridia bacterium]|nr:GIY-YIG nuclease family protein [Clostridia bacterium]
MRNNVFFVYIMTSYNGNAMYIGITNDLARRVAEHKSDAKEGFTKRYRIHKLVYYEEYDDVYAAIAREKQLKNWSRAKKNQLVETVNPEWEEISLTEIGG